MSKYIFGDTTKETLLELPQGQLYIVRPLSPKGYSELIFRDAAASIRRTGQQYQYQLVVQRFYEEGEAELLAEEEDDESTNTSGTHGVEKDERTFLLDEGLHLRTEDREGGEIVIAWRDLSGDVGDLYEFVCDKSVKSADVAQFELAAVQCQYERKFRQPHATASDDDLRQFTFPDEEPIPTASGADTPNLSPSRSRTQLASEKMVRASETPKRETKTSTPIKTPETRSTPKKTVAPAAAKQPQSREVLANEIAELHLFDFESGSFMLQDDKVRARVSETGDWQYWLQVGSDTREWLGRDISPDINPVFNFEYLSFIFNQYTDDGSAYSWLLRFKAQDVEERFQEGFMQALWEHLHQMKWVKAKEDERDYVLDAFNDLVLEDDAAQQQREEAEEEEESDVESDDARPRSEHYDSDEEEDDVQVRDPGNKAANSHLAVGYKHDRTFVARGDRIGVFKNTADNKLDFQTTIANIKTTKGKAFDPKKMMLHQEDANMIMQDPGNPHSLFRMDIERGRIVDEWKVHDDITVNEFAPENKYAQMTAEQTLLGLSHNGLYRIDPRLAGNKLVDSAHKQYASKNDFSAAATTEKGYIAVASNKGDIRMFDRLGINAKTHIPALGDPIIGVDVSGDGRWVLATTRTYLLLIDAQQKEGKNEGKLGFEKPFGKDNKPQPRRLTLSPQHIAQMQHETKGGLSFTSAHFNAGVDDKETTIITASGPFVVSWSMKKVLLGQRDPYVIKRYDQLIKADNFKYGTDKHLIVAMADEVDMVAKRALKRPTRESIAGAATRRSSGSGGYATPVRRTPAAGTRGSHLRSEIVDSPY